MTSKIEEDESSLNEVCGRTRGAINLNVSDEGLDDDRTTAGISKMFPDVSDEPINVGLRM